MPRAKKAAALSSTTLKVLKKEFETNPFVSGALVCTSGSALLNFYPAIAEAYYSDVPLVILSAMAG